MSVIEVAEAAGEHSDLFGETLSNFFDIPVLHQNSPHYIHLGFLKKRRYSRVHISLNEVFFMILKKPSSSEINDTLYESQVDFHWDSFESPNT
mgnify:CR=1 FL=1